MNVHVRLFAALAEGAGVRTLSLQVPAESTARTIRDLIASRFPRVQGLCDRSALAVNAEYVDADRPLHDGDEVALVPPVSGG